MEDHKHEGRQLNGHRIEAARRRSAGSSEASEAVMDTERTNDGVLLSEATSTAKLSMFKRSPHRGIPMITFDVGRDRSGWYGATVGMGKGQMLICSQGRGRDAIEVDMYLASQAALRYSGDIHIKYKGALMGEFIGTPDLVSV